MSEINKIVNISKLKVKFNNKLVGYIMDVDHSYCFEYDEQWLKHGFSISPFSLPLKQGVFKPNEKNKLFKVFEDSLPDGWGMRLMTLMLSKYGINIRKTSPLTLLSLLNDNVMGGLTYEPAQVINYENDGIDLDHLNKQVNNILNDSYSNNDLDHLFNLGASSGGARPKAHIKINDEYWIIKFISSKDTEDAGIKEYASNILAKECGINTNEFKLFKSKQNKGYFGSKRFDRIKNHKIHMISLASILEQDFTIPSLDYISLLQVINLISVNKKTDLYDAYSRMVFNVLYGNKDDHSKNFAFVYSETEQGYRLSPFYDITNTPHIAEHHLAINGSGNPNINDMLDVAKEIGLSLDKCKDIINKIKNILNH